jgi:hypothetical protein
MQKFFVLSTLVPLIAILASPETLAQGQALDNNTVIEMQQKGVSSALIIEAIRSAPQTDFRFGIDDYEAFTRAKVGPEILRAMSERQRQVTASASPTQTPTATAIASGRDSDAYLHAGTNETSLSGSVSVPHASASATNGQFTFGYQRYITPWFSVGPSAGGSFIGSALNEFNFLGVAQFSPKMAERTYLVAGIGAGVNRVEQFGESDMGFLSGAFVGPRVFVSRNVAFDIRYVLLYRRFEGAAFKDSSSSGVTLGFSVFF